MPVYNVAPFVRRAMESVLSQSWTDLELIVVDDGSTDSTAHEVAEINDPRVAFMQVEHSGVAHARNTAFSALWGRMASCGRLVIGPSNEASPDRPITNRPQV